MNASRDLMVRRLYDFDFAGPCPRILDVGCNVGAAVVLWKQRWPEAEIVCFEPDPELAATLRRNMATNRIAGVEIIEACAWIRDGTVQFQPDGAEGGAITDGVGRSVPSIDLRQWLEGRSFDLIKIDIEGAENEVLPHAFEQIARSDRLIFEWHADISQPQRLGLLLGLLERAGYRYHLQSEIMPDAPLRWRSESFDNQICIYAQRLVEVGRS